VSNGTAAISHEDKSLYVEKLASDFEVISEVGFKDNSQSENFAPKKWVESIERDLVAGARFVTLETRESGRGGMCRPNGELRYGLIEDDTGFGHRCHAVDVRSTHQRLAELFREARRGRGQPGKYSL
jgi:phosphosulfolactate synthase